MSRIMSSFTRWFTRWLTLGLFIGVSCLLVWPERLNAQNGAPPGAGDPAQMRQRMQERMKQRMEVQDDAEWKLISSRIAKVIEARRGLGVPGGPGGMGGPGGPGGPPPQAAGLGPGDSGPPQRPRKMALTAVEPKVAREASGDRAARNSRR